MDVLHLIILLLLAVFITDPFHFKMHKVRVSSLNINRGNFTVDSLLDRTGEEPHMKSSTTFSQVLWTYGGGRRYFNSIQFI